MPLIHQGKSQNEENPTSPSQLIALFVGRPLLNPSQKGCSCKASYQPAQLIKAPNESIILITQFICVLVNSFYKHKRRKPRQKYPFDLCKNVQNREDTVISKTVSTHFPSSISHIIKY